MSRLVLFDVDGTLIDSAGAGRRAVERAFADVFAVAAASGKDGVRYAGMTDPAIFAALAAALGIEGPFYADRLDRLHAAYLARLEAEMARPDPRRRVLPGVRGLLEALAGRGDVHLGLLTGNLEAGARIKLAPFDLNRFFADGGFGSDHPDRSEIARIARERVSARLGIDFDPARVVVVGDTEHDVSCARANGFRSVAVESGWVPREVLARARPDALLADLSDRASVQSALGLL